MRKECEAGRVVQEGKRWKVLGEEYHAVVSSAPWPQSAALFGMRESEVAFEPNLTACFEYLIPWDGSKYATLDSTGQEPLAWVGCENAKEGRIQGGKSVYVIQASPAYSQKYLEKDPADWLSDLSERLEKSWGLSPDKEAQLLGIAGVMQEGVVVYSSPLHWRMGFICVGIRSQIRELSRSGKVELRWQRKFLREVGFRKTSRRRGLNP